MTVALQSVTEGTLLPIRVTPKAGAERLGPVHDGRLKVAVTVAPDKGKANAAVLKLLAKALEVPKSNLAITAGETDRAKTILVRGLSPAEVGGRLGL